MARRTFTRFLVAGLLAATLAGPALAQPTNQPLPTTNSGPRVQEPFIYRSVVAAEQPGPFIRIDPFEGFVLGSVADQVAVTANVAQAVGPCVERAWTWVMTGEEPAVPVAPMPRRQVGSEELRIHFGIEPLGSSSPMSKELFSFYLGIMDSTCPPAVVPAGHTTVVAVPPWTTERMQEKYSQRNEGRVPILPPVRPGQPAPICEDVPTDAEVLKALGQQSRGVPYVFESYRDDVTIVKNRLVDKIDPPRVFPLVGPAQLHHCHWECVVYFTETVQSSYPFPAVVKKKRVQVVYIDKDFLHLAVGQEAAVPMPQLACATPTAPARCEAIQLAAASVVQPRPSGTWYRELPGMVSAVTFKGDEMKATLTANNFGTVVTLTVTADCSMTKDGTVHGVVTGVDVNVSGGKDPADMELASLALELQAFVDQPFAFRCRTIDGSVMVSNFRVSCVHESNTDFAAAIKPLLSGLYKPAVNGVPPTPKPDKLIGPVSVWSSDPNVRMQQLLSELQPVGGAANPPCPVEMALPGGPYLRHPRQYVPENVDAPFERIGVDFNVILPNGQPQHYHVSPPCPPYPTCLTPSGFGTVTRQAQQIEPVDGWVPSNPRQCPRSNAVIAATPLQPCLPPPLPATTQAYQLLIPGDACVPYTPCQAVPPPACPGPVCSTGYAQPMLPPPPPHYGSVRPTADPAPMLPPQPLQQTSLGTGSAPVASRTVTIKDVVELAQCGAGDDVIINQMRNTNSKYTLSVADIKYLKMCGISDKIVIEMQGGSQAQGGCQLPAVPMPVSPVPIPVFNTGLTPPRPIYVPY